MSNRASYKLVTAPAVEPVSLSDVKLFVKQDGTADDTLLTSLIVTSRQSVEEFTKRALITQTWKLTMDAFPQYPEHEGYSLGPVTTCETVAIQLSRQPIQSISSIVTYDTQNDATTLETEAYTLDAEGGRILLNEGYSWPSELRERAGIVITFVAGYGLAGTVPSPVCQAITQFVAEMYQNRKCSDLPDGVKTILAPYMLPEAFGLV